jgi:hypothetical protein
LDQTLTEILEDDLCSEVLFEAYRHVALSKSRELGPRIIALLTAALVNEGRHASEHEEAMFLAAENLSDDELLAFAVFVDDECAKLSDSEGRENPLRFKWSSEQFDSNWPRREGVPTGPINLHECLGRWAVKLKAYGIIADDVEERQFDYEENSERHIDQPGSVREISWWIIIPAEYLRLVVLIRRANGEEGACA